MVSEQNDNFEALYAAHPRKENCWNSGLTNAVGSGGFGVVGGVFKN